MLVVVYGITMLTFEPGFKGSEDRPRFGERTRIQWMGGLAKIKSQYYRHVGRGLLHKPAAYLNQDVRDRRIDQDLGREPGFNGWEDWPRSKVRITAMLVGVYCINPLTFEPGFKGSKDRPRFGGEPGCPSTPLRGQDRRMGKDKIEVYQHGGGRIAYARCIVLINIEDCIGVQVLYLR